MAALNRRRRTAQQILLRRALSKSVGRDCPSIDFVQNEGPLTGDPQQLKRILERSTSKSVRKVNKILVANSLRILGERKTAEQQQGCELQKKDSRSWRKLKPRDDNPTVSCHSIKLNTDSRASSRSRHSSTTYPSTWQLNINKAKEELKKNSKGSLDEIINCSILNRTPYDHKLNTPIKSDNSCQCYTNKKARRRGKKKKLASLIQPATISKNSPMEEGNFQRISSTTNSKDCVEFKKLKQRVYSGEEFSPDRRICKNASKTSGYSKVSFKCKESCPGSSYKDYGGYSPSETDIEMQDGRLQKLQSRSEYLNKIERISKPPPGVSSKWSLKLPSNTEMEKYIARGIQERSPAQQPKNVDKDRGIQRKISKCYCTNGKGKFSQIKSDKAEDISSKRSLNYKSASTDALMGSPVERARYERNRDKLSSQTSLLSSEQFVNRINNAESEESFSQSQRETPSSHQNKVIICRRNPESAYQTNKYASKPYPYYDQRPYASNDSIDIRTRQEESQTNYKQMDKRAYNIKGCRCPKFEPGRSPKSPSDRDPQGVVPSTNVTPSGSSKRENGRKSGPSINNIGVMYSHKFSEAITQTSETLITPKIYGNYIDYQETPYISTPTKLVQPANQRQSNYVRSYIGAPIQENVKQAKLSQVPHSKVQTKRQQPKSTHLILKESNSSLFEYHEDNYGRAETNLHEAVGHTIRRKEENIREEKSKIFSKSQQPRQMNNKSTKLPNQNGHSQEQRKAKPSLSPVIESYEEQYSLPQSTSVELVEQGNAPKTKKTIRTGKRKSCRCYRCCSRCCSPCCPRKKSVKKSSSPSGRDKQVKSKTSTINNDNCDVREILNILQATVTGLEKQINIRKGFEINNNEKSAYQDAYKYIQSPTQNVPYQQVNSHSERNTIHRPMSTFGNPTSLYQTSQREQFMGDIPTNYYTYSNLASPFPLNNEANPNSIQASENIYQDNMFQRRPWHENVSSNNGASPASVDRPTNIPVYQNNAIHAEASPNVYQINTNQREGAPENYSINKDPTSPNVEVFYKDDGIFRRTEFQNNASNPQASLNAYQNNTNQSRVLPENYFIKNDPTPANVEVRCKDEIISRRSEYDYPIETSDRKSQPYGNQESFNESSSYPNHTQVHSTYPIDDYNNQSLRQSFNRPCINAQCNINNPQIEIFQGNAFERKPITDSAYSQGSKGTTNSGRQSHREMVAFPNSETIDPESYTLNDNNVSNIERNAQVPLQICDNSNCPHLTSQYYPMSNNSQSYQTEIDFPEANPDGDSVSCKGPEFCPYKGMYKPDVGPNNRGVVTFQDSDRSTLSRDRNRQQPAHRSWENPIYPMSKRVISYRKMNGLTRCNPDCYCNQKEIPFQKGGTAHNYDNFVRNPYGPENNIVNGNINRTGRCSNRNCPEKESFHSNGKSSYQQEFAEGSGRQENPSEWGGRCRIRENYNYSENKLYYNAPLNQNINQSYQNVGSQSNYNFSTMFPNQDDKSRTGPRITVVKCHQKSEEKVIKSNPNKESFQATSECERFHRFSNKENINSRLIKGCIKPSQMYKNQPDNQPHIYKNSDKNQTYAKQDSIDDSARLYPKMQKDEAVAYSYAKRLPNQGFVTNKINRNKQSDNAVKACVNPKCIDRLKNSSNKESSSKDRQIPEKSKRFGIEGFEKNKDHISKACENTNCSKRKVTNGDQNKYTSKADKLGSERKYVKKLCEHPKSPDKKSIQRTKNENGYKANGSRKINSEKPLSKEKPQNKRREMYQRKTPKVTMESDPIFQTQNLENKNVEYEEEPPLCPEDCYNRQTNQTIKNTKKIANDFQVCDHPKYQDKLRKVANNTNDEESPYEKEVCGNLHSPDKVHKNCDRNENRYINNSDRVCSQSRPLKRDRERSSYDKIYDSDDLESCISDCPHHHRVLFTDLRICKNKRKYNSRQRSGRSDFFVDGHIRPKTCNTCQRYVPLERDRQVINKYCTPCNAKEKIKTKSEKSLKESKIICCRPGKSAPIFVKNRHNPLVTDPIFNSYDKHMLENFEKFKEKNKPAQCIEKCPFPDYFTQSKENIPASALSSDCRCEIIPEEYSPPCDCQSVESIEHEDNRKTKSKISFFSCCTKSPKDESKSKPELQKEEKTESKSSGFSCLKRKEKTPQDNSKSEKKTKSSGLSFFKEKEKKTAENPNEKNCSKSKEFSCFKQKERNPQEKDKQKNATPSKKSTGFLCFKKSEKRQKDDRPKSQEKSFGGKNEKIKMEEGNQKSSKRSRLFGWCRKSQAAKESNLKTEKASSATECSCPPSEDQEIPVINSPVQFCCPCAPKEIDDGDVKVLYDSSFRFQNESCSCGEIPKTIYCHSDAQTPGQDTSDWYASSHAASTTSRSQFEEQEISYCPCASANGFYKIVR